MAADELMQIRITADFKEAEGAFLKMAKVATAFESDFRRISNGLNKEFNKINGMAELFGNSTNVVKDKMDALKRSMEQLMTLGLQPMNPEVQKLKAQYDALATSLNNTTEASKKANNESNNSTNNLKKSNQQWTNLALVIQDLPYGFRGIQNNLPALIGGFAGVSGMAYVLGSALIAIWTKYGDAITETIFKTNALDAANKELQKGMIDSVKSTSGAREELFKVASVIKAGKDNLIDKTAALDYYNKQLGVTFGTAQTLEEAEAKMVEKTPKYIEAIGMKAKAQYYYAKAAEFAIKGDIAGLEDQTNIFDKLIALSKGFVDATTIGPKQIIKNVLGSLSTAQNEAVSKITKNSKLIGDILFKSGNDAMNEYFKAFKQAGLTDKEIAEIFKKFNDARNKANEKANKLSEKEIAEREKALAIIAENEKKAALQLYDEKDKELREVTSKYRIQIDLATKYSQDTTLLEEAWRSELTAIRKKWDDKDLKQAQEAAERIAKIQLDTRFDLANGISKINDDFASEDIKNTKAQLSSTLKATKGNYQAQKDAIQLAIDKLIEYKAAAKDAGSESNKFDEAIKELGFSLDGLVDPLEQMKLNIEKTFNELATNVLAELGTQIGNVISGGEFSMEGFLNLLANAIIEIGKHLVVVSGLFAAVDKLFKNPSTWPLAIATGIAAIAAGTAMKNNASKSNPVKKFADGGIISGPTYGLMGEYPGAKSNPEVVAPLDKLKDMIGGGGGGTFMLRGQDLLLSVNRAQKASNLKGQNISLA